MGVWAPETASSGDLASYKKIVQKYALAATFWAKTKFLIFWEIFKNFKIFEKMQKAKVTCCRGNILQAANLESEKGTYMLVVFGDFSNFSKIWIS